MVCRKASPNGPDLYSSECQVNITKVFFYRDLPLLLKIITASSAISILSLLEKTQYFLQYICSNKIKSYPLRQREKVIRYVNFWMFARKKLGMNNSCLHYSLLLCWALRDAGFDALVNFGVQTNPMPQSGDGTLLGHCWVSVADEALQTTHHVIFQYPYQEVSHAFKAELCNTK